MGSDENRPPEGRAWRIGVVVVVILLALILGTGGRWEKLMTEVQRFRLPSSESPSTSVAQEEPAAVGEEPAVADDVAAEDQPAAVQGPSFDVVRVSPDGQALIAGRGHPGDRLRVIMDGKDIGETEVGGDGSFAVFVTLDASDVARELWLLAEGGGGDAIQSADTVIIAPRPAEVSAAESPAMEPTDAEPATAEEQVDVAAIDTAEAVPAMTDTATTADAPAEGLPAPVADVPVPTEERAPEVLVSSADGVGVANLPPLADGMQISLDSIDYGATGDVVLRGRSVPGGSVRVVLDGQTLSDIASDDEGVWKTDLSGLDPGTYDLRLERLDAEGATTGAVSLPFHREEPGDIAKALNGAAARVITVQPGATLWAIARDRYGDGIRYVQVFEANRDLIRNPDLIYPGQVFGLPDVEDEAE